MDSKPRVEEYMTHEVSTVSPEDTVADVTRRIVESQGHNGFPVCRELAVEGFVSARDLLAADDETPIREVMSTDTLVADPEMSVTDAARVILRSGIQKLPVVDDEGRLIGILSNTDVVRSQIERVTPEKVGKLRRSLGQIHEGVELTEERRQVRLADLTPTQERVYADELAGRRYELEHGLAEPLVVIDNTGVADEPELYLADGHHRVLAADSMDIPEMDAYVIVLSESVDLGMAETAAKHGLTSIKDIAIVDYARHPLVETTERLQ
ncbi:MAG: CBS domain-containing protein [Halohasta sp.]